MSEHPADPHMTKEKTVFALFAHPVFFITVYLCLLFWSLAVFSPPEILALFLFPILPVFIIPLLLGIIGMVAKRQYVQAALGLLLIAFSLFDAPHLLNNIKYARFNRQEPAMVLLADTVLHDPKYANTKGTVEIPLPENLSTLTKGKPLRVKFPEQRKDSCQVCFFSCEKRNGEGIYYIYESDPPEPVVSHDKFPDYKEEDEYFGDIRKNFRLGRIH